MVHRMRDGERTREFPQRLGRSLIFRMRMRGLLQCEQLHFFTQFAHAQSTPQAAGDGLIDLEMLRNLPCVEVYLLVCTWEGDQE